MLREEDMKEVQERLSDMKDPVKLIFFTQQLAGACQYCVETERLLRDVAGLSEKLELEILNFITDKEQVESLKIDKIPATCVQSKKDIGIRFYGIPAGYEFASLLETILMISSGDSGLSDDVKKQLAQVQKPVHIQVFATPTCPYCPKAALTAIKLAMENETVTADIVEIGEFPHLAQKYGVMGVPKVVINEKHSFEGALPEALFIEHIVEAIK